MDKDNRIKELEEEVKRLREYKAALTEWLDKTEWVQDSLTHRELGMHRADAIAQRIVELEQERDQMEARLGHCQRFLASGILYTYDELLRHDADVIDRACSELELRARKYGYYYTINLIQMREYANQLRQQAKENIQ
jgi:hypothetical protein